MYGPILDRFVFTFTKDFQFEMKTLLVSNALHKVICD